MELERWARQRGGISRRSGIVGTFEHRAEPMSDLPKGLGQDQSWPIDQVLLACLARSNSVSTVLISGVRSESESVVWAWA